VNKKSIVLLFFALCWAAAFNFTGKAFAFDDEPAPKVKIDMQLFDEYYKLIQGCLIGAKVDGSIKQLVNGAFVESKFTAYSKDLQYKKIDVTSYGERFSKDLADKKIDLFPHGDKFSLIVTPDKVWYYFDKTNYVIYYEQKKNIAKFNSMTYMNFVKNDGKITKKISGNQVIYQIVDYSHYIKQKVIVDSTTNKIKSQLIETDSGEKIEFTYKNWERWNGSDSVFKYPVKIGEKKCAD